MNAAGTSSAVARRGLRITDFAFAALLAIVTALIYQPAWHGGFIWDDDAYITHNELLTAPDGLRRIWFSLASPSQYFPLVYTTFRFEHALWGLNPTGYHLVNVALHIVNALLVWRILARLAVPGAMLAAAIFAFHPVHVESVAWITERKNVLMGVFFLGALWSWIRFVEVERGHWKWYALALAMYALALFSKTTACTLPAALLLVIWLKRRPIAVARWLQVAPFVALGVAMGAVTIWWERFHQGTRGADFALGIVERCLIASRAVWFYLGKLFWPADLTFIYPKWDISVSSPLAYAWLLMLALLVVAVLALRQRTGRAPEVALLFFVATLLPMLGFIMLYTFRYTYVADHYQYLASIGPIALCAAAISWAGEVRSLPRATTAVVSAVTACALAFLAWKQAGMYSNIEALWRTTIARSPRSWMAHNNLGIELEQQGRASEAAAAYRRTLELQPRYPEAHYNLANALLKIGDVAGALEHSANALAIQPGDPDAHITRGNALLAAGRRVEARTEYETACTLRPHDFDAHYNLALLLSQAGDLDGAIREFRTALEQRDDVKARVGLANSLLAIRDGAGAIAEFTRVLELAPHHLTALCNMAWALATSSDARLRDGAKAVAFAEDANRQAGGADPVVLRALAAAYAEAGRFDEANGAAETALRLADQQHQPDLAAALQQELAVYKTGRPFRE